MWRLKNFEEAFFLKGVVKHSMREVVAGVLEVYKFSKAGISLVLNLE